MKRVNAFLNLFACTWRPAWFGVMSAFVLVAAAPPYAHAINIIMEYTDEGDPTPHPENPSWDPDGTILKAHFEAAEAIWEALLPGGGEYDFDYHWDNDIDGLGQYTTGIDDFIEIHPDQIWYADPSPFDNLEFTQTITQRLYSGLSASEQSTYFPGTAPPGALEVGYRGGGSNTAMSASGTGVTAANGRDLLSTVVHEVGHALGLNGIEPGNYNIDPQHIGGIQDVTVLEGGGGHLAGQGAIPFLMCENCGGIGVRRFPTATDVLVIAEDQGITVVQLARVGRISSGVWSDTNAWIGGDVPDITQDVYITQGGAVTLDINAEARNLRVAPANSFDAMSNQFTADGTLTFDGASLSVGSGGSIAANSINGQPGLLTTAAGSLVRFNQFTRGSSSTTSVNFNGSLAIGYSYSGLTGAATFDPAVINDITQWNIAENLTVGDQANATLVINNGTWNVGGDIAVGRADGLGGPAEIRVESTGLLNVTGDIFVHGSGKLIYKNDRKAEFTTYEIDGGQTTVQFPPMSPPYLTTSVGGYLTFEDTTSAGDATINVEGGTGDDAPGGLVTFKGDASAGDALPLARAVFRTKGGRRGPTLPIPLEVAGFGGQVRFEGTAGARDSTFINEGGAEYHGGTGGRTIFAQTSSAEQATIDNHGATYFNAGGGATHFFDNSTAASANITNHADATFIYAGMEARTVFYDFSSAGNATIENEGAPSGTNLPGRTEFRGSSSAAFSNIHNRGHLTPGGLAGRTFFYDTATAGDAFIRTYEGYSDVGRIEFHGNSRAERARLIVENVPEIVGSIGNGGHIIFRDNSRAEKAQIFLRADACCNGVQFYNSASADDAQITIEDGAGGINFWDFSKTADSTTPDPTIISLGRGSVMSFYDQSRAEDAFITLANGAQVQFNMNSSAGQAQIVAAGSALYPWAGGAITFNTTSTVNNATITLHGGAVPLGTGATASFINGAHAGTATVIANGGTNGGGGATVTFNAGAKGDSARLVANAGATVDFFDQRLYGDTSVGSIEGAGTFWLRGSLLTTGNRNTSTTVSGSIIDHPTGFVTGGRLIKVGTGTLTLAGANTYSGLTTVAGGTLRVDGSIAGDVLVQSGARLEGTGNIPRMPTVEAGGVFAPGTSPGTITVGGLTMMPGATLEFELGEAARDHIVLTNNGNVSLAGILNISLLDGFMPALGQSFSLFEGAIGSITGAFDSIIAPTFNGLTFDVIQSASSILLQVGDAPFLPGDYNGNGSVDAADYTVWQDSLGQTGAGLAADGDGNNEINAGDHDVWRANFGQTAGSGMGAAGFASAFPSVPEPGSLALAAVGLVALISSCRRRKWHRRGAFSTDAINRR